MLKTPEREIAQAVSIKMGAVRSTNSIHVSVQEWRWLIVVASLLTLLAFAPLIWVALRGTPGWQFMGVLHNPMDGGTYLSKMQLGFANNWLVYFQHTPEDHAGAFIQVLYLLLGHVARITSLPMLVVFHVARLGAALIMYVALYQFAAVIWSRVRARRTFFLIVSLASGLGWLGSSLFQDIVFPDMVVPEAYPFYSTLVNIHFPLSIACLALLAGLLITALRPGSESSENLVFGLPIAALLSVLLALLYPQALAPLGLAIAAYTGMLFVRRNPSSTYTLRWLLAIGLPALPFALYYAITVRFNPAMALWNQQNYTAAPAPLALVLGFGLPLLVGLPGIFRAARRFERDGDWLMLLWLVAMVVTIYLPTNTQRRFMVGMMIPIAYFATRSIEDVWLNYVGRRWRMIVVAVLAPLMTAMTFITLFIPIYPALRGNPEQAVGIFLESDYADMFRWLHDRVGESDVILAAPIVSLWVPGWTGARVVYGHPYETLDAPVKEQAVRSWYAATEDCSSLIDKYHVRYVIVGPEEESLGGAACVGSMRLIARSNMVSLYVP